MALSQSAFRIYKCYIMNSFENLKNRQKNAEEYKQNRHCLTVLTDFSTMISKECEKESGLKGIVHALFCLGGI